MNKVKIFLAVLWTLLLIMSVVCWFCGVASSWGNVIIPILVLCYNYWGEGFSDK